ncbi:hypothetical protein RRG08_029216 [Elysia crispata]|uniref:Uncharacterized protein n=1 Tax=Elysia crispata TaxID=231223 RepID=A0AAE1AKA6_9GAST|nr:hypothetical protein RRG08_029216 [Elysia crispata]
MFNFLFSHFLPSSSPDTTSSSPSNQRTHVPLRVTSRFLLDNHPCGVPTVNDTTPAVDVPQSCSLFVEISPLDQHSLLPHRPRRGRSGTGQHRLTALTNSALLVLAALNPGNKQRRADARVNPTEAVVCRGPHISDFRA